MVGVKEGCAGEFSTPEPFRHRCLRAPPGQRLLQPPLRAFMQAVAEARGGRCGGCGGSVTPRRGVTADKRAIAFS